MIRRAAAAIAILCALAGVAAQLHAADGCVTLNRGSGCKSGAGTWTAGNCLCATDTSNAAFGAVTASGLTCTDCVDGSDLADSVTCDANPWVLDCGISISTQNTGATNRLTLLPNESVDGGSACPAGGNLYIQDTDDTSAEGYAVCLPDSSSLSIGGSTNYAKVDNTGHLTFTGTAKPWEDLRVEPVVRNTGVNNPTFEEWFDDPNTDTRGVYVYSFSDETTNNQKELHFTAQMPHAWDSGDIHVHLHWLPSVADTEATPQWGLEYSWAEPDEVFGDTTTLYATGNEQSDTDLTQYKHYITEFDAITPPSTANGLSTIMIARVWRNSGDDADTYNAASNKAGLLYIDIHHQLSSVGSTDEYTK